MLDFAGTVVAAYDAPDCGSLGSASGTPVVLNTGSPECFAVLVDFEGSGAALYVYDAERTLIYHESLSESGAAIAATDLDGTGTEELLVGGRGKLWQYTLTNADTSRQ